MDNQIPDEIKSERMNRLLSLQDEIALSKNLPYVDRCEKILVDSLSKNGDENTYSARTLTNKLVHFTAEENYIGEFKYAKITKAAPYTLYAEIIK